MDKVGSVLLDCSLVNFWYYHVAEFYPTNSYDSVHTRTNAHDKINSKVQADFREIWTLDDNDTSPFPHHQSNP